MLTRLDHVIIAVRDLDRAVEMYTRLGFEVIRGGRNPGLGTWNALIRFGLDYLELLSVDDRGAAERAHPRGGEIIAYLDAHAGGLLSFVVASDDIEADIARATAHGFVGGQPTSMQRLRPDGKVLRWRLWIPGEVSFRQTWPLLIQWDTPDRERLEWEQPGAHANGAFRVNGLSLVVRSLDAAIELYGTQLGLPVGPSRQVPEMHALAATVDLGGCPIDLLMPTNDGPLKATLEAEGEGPFVVTVGVRGDSRAVALEDPLGVRLIFREVR